MLEEIQGLYKQHQQPCFLYLSSEVIKVLIPSAFLCQYIALFFLVCFVFLILAVIGTLFCRYLAQIHLVQTIWKSWSNLSSTTQHLCLQNFRFGLLISSFIYWNCLHKWFSDTISLLQDFTSRPDLVDDCFLLASRCIRYCPQLFFPSPVFPCLVDCSMIGITVQHRFSLSLSLCTLVLWAKYTFLLVHLHTWQHCALVLWAEYTFLLVHLHIWQHVCLLIFWLPREAYVPGAWYS